MNAFLYGIALQFKLDIRSKTMLITCYVVPLLFFAFMGGIFTSVNPEAANTLIPSMTIFVVSMGALIGLPPSLTETYGSEIKKVYKANGVPLYLGVVTHFLSAFLHLSVTSIIVFAVAPFAFHASLPSNLPLYFVSLALFILVSLSIGCVFGLMCKTQSKLVMLSQLVFLPSIMLSGIMFPSSLLPRFLQYISYVFPATLGFKAMTEFQGRYLLFLLGIFFVMSLLSAFRLRRISEK